VNWLYEEIYPLTFLEKYNTWWSLDGQHGEDDIQFGVLILRICVNSIQLLPHPNYPTDRVLQEPLEVLEAHCNASATKLDAIQPRQPSLLRIQHLLIYTPMLCNLGKAEESYEVLREAVKEAQKINLFLEEKWIGLTEFDKEVRRKIFWNLYVWDRQVILSAHFT
jgi:Fungal specific transcription factor domain